MSLAPGPIDLYGYFDYAASEPPFPEALHAYLEASVAYYGNPSSAHRRGRRAREHLEAARITFKRLLSASEGVRLVLTSGGTEANNIVLDSVLGSRTDGRLLIAPDVHASAWYATDRYSGRVDVAGVDGGGILRPEDLAKSITPAHHLVSIVHGNNETGVIQDLDAIHAVCTECRTLLHVDGVQTAGRLPLCLGDMQGVLFTFSAHKFGGLRGCGGILTGSPEVLASHTVGGGQEGGLIAGTENLAGFVGAVAALKKSLEIEEACSKRLRTYGQRVVEAVTRAVPATVVNSSPEGLPGLISLSIPGLNGAIAVTEMAMRGFDLSSGSACHSGATEPSRVIRAMGRDRITALGTLRISMGYGTREPEVAAMISALTAVVERGVEVR